jgi:heterodisulfide reductase subunit A-like polyferredoxin
MTGILHRNSVRVRPSPPKEGTMVEETNGKIGAVLVVGGGIGGMQAALDLAEGGFKVYLVEKSPAIGGVMAQLDKTFPTDDCAMCTLAPRLVAVARHPNVSLLTYAEVEHISGAAGNFAVKIRKRRRFIDLDKCTGCAECEAACPVEMVDDFNAGLSTRKAIYRPYPQAIPNVFTVDKLGEKSPCKVFCPAKVNAQGYVQLIAQGKFVEALDVVRERNPFPTICGRACHHPCEEECLRQDVDEPVAICALKRFVADYAIEHGEESPEAVTPTKEEKIAVIGAGPSGLTCALRLAEMGYPTTVIDAAEIPGGMMTSCLPEYRIPTQAAMYDVDRILARGMTLKMGTRVGKDVTFEGLRQEFDAIYVAVGAQDPATLPLENVDAKGVLHGLPFLRESKAGRKPEEFGEKAIVIGGGDVAVDSAKTAVRLGARQVHLVCLETRDLRSKDRMPAHDWGIEEAEEEGVIIHPRLGPAEIVTANGRVAGLKTVACTSVYADDGGFSPQFDEGKIAPTIEGDTVILAIGQRSDLSGLEALGQERGRIKVDPVTLETSLPGVFAGGDVVTGPASVIEAVQHGHEAAISIDRFLRGEGLNEGRQIEEQIVTEVWRKVERQSRQIMPKEPASERKTSFCEIERGFTKEQAIAEAKRCLSCSICAECLRCVEVCQAEAIDHEMPEEALDLKVGAVVLAPGFSLFDPAEKLEFGMPRFPNVVTGLQFERIQSASGPYGGHILRPSDEKPPHRVAFIQCVGSRDYERDYCSSVCCMYATKEAIIAKEHEPDLECTVFYMDMRAFGKGFDVYYERAKGLGVRYVRCRPSHVEEDPATKNLKVHYEAEDGSHRMEEFDMVVLSVGLRPPERARELAERFGIDLDEYGFAATGPFSLVETSREGICVCGPFSEPKDIPETVTEASAAVADAMRLLAEKRGTEIIEREYPPEKDVTGQPPHIGVFVCHCGRNIGGVVDVPAVVEVAKALPDVVYAEENLYTCSTDTQAKIRQTIEEHDLNRVVVASCTPRTHEPLFRDTLQEAGLNPYLFEMANIRDQCSWVHMREPEAATVKAKDLVRMAVAKARLLEPLKKGRIAVNPNALVIGGGMSGMTAALNLADQGFRVHLVEKAEELGGAFRKVRFLLDGASPAEWLEETIERTLGHPRIEVHLGSRLKSVAGSVGDFTSVIAKNGDETTVEHGAVILAVGAEEATPTEYLYGSDPRVMTQREFEEKLAAGEDVGERVVMIQCVGSREEGRAYCSRICCTQAMKNALHFKKKKEEGEVFILYRDVRTYGLKERFYTQARERGVRFIHYEPEAKPEVSVEDGKLRVAVNDPVLRRRVVTDADAVVLAPAIVPAQDAEELAKMLKVPLNADGFFLEAHMKLRPIDFATEGIYLCGMAHSPKLVNESVVQAMGAAARAATLLAKDELELEAAISEVIDANCDGCAYCIDPCPFDALTLIEYVRGDQIKKTVQTNPALCKGCGVCMATCPKQGIFVRHFKPEQINAMVDAALQPE